MGQFAESIKVRRSLAQKFFGGIEIAIDRIFRVQRETREIIDKDDFLFNFAMVLGKPGDFMKSFDF